MCSLHRLVWMKIGFLFNICRLSPLGSRSSEWAQPSPRAFAICWPIDDRCVWLEAALRRIITVWHQSTVRAIKELMDPYVFVSLSRYFDVTQWSSCTALLQVEHTWCHRPSPMADRHHDVEPIRVSRHRDPPHPHPPQSVAGLYHVLMIPWISFIASSSFAFVIVLKMRPLVAKTVICRLILNRGKNRKSDFFVKKSGIFFLGHIAQPYTTYCTKNSKEYKYTLYLLYRLWTL